MLATFPLDRDLTLCQHQADAALARLTRLEAAAPEIASTFPTPLLRFIALQHKALLAHAASNAAYTPAVAALCTNCLRAYPPALASTQSARPVPSLAAWLRSSLDSLAALVESHDPTRVQQLLGETKLQYLAAAQRLTVHPAVEHTLSERDLHTLLATPIAPPVLVRSALITTASNLGADWLATVVLFDHPTPYTASGAMPPAAATLNFLKPHSPAAPWTLLPSRP